MTTPPHTFDRRARVWGVLALAFALLAWGEVRATAPYTSPAFVIGYFWTELQVTALLLVATALSWPMRRLGLRPPRSPGSWVHVMPIFALVALAFGIRLWVATLVPADAMPDTRTGALLLRTTLLVGLNEEWLFRGVALAAFSHCWGWRRGWIAALLAFGGVHLLNLMGGVPAAAAAFQFLNTIVVGSVFLLAAVATRSLLWPMLGHAAYDWSVIDATRYVQAGASPFGSLVLTIVAALLGLLSLRALWRMPDRMPFPDDVAASIRGTRG